MGALGNDAEHDDDANKTERTILKVAVPPDMHARIIERCAITDRPKGSELLRYARLGMHADQVLGIRADSAYDLMVAFCTGGAESLIELLIKRGIEPAHLHQMILSAETRMKVDALPQAERERLLYGTPPQPEPQS